MRGSMPWPARIVENGPRQRDHVGIAGTEDGLGLLEFTNEPDGDNGNPRCLLHPACERDLIARPDRDLLGGGETPARHVNGAAAARLQCLRKQDCLINVPSAVDPIGARHAHGYRTIGGEGGADRFKDFQRKAHSVLQASAIFIFSLIGERGEKLVQQIAMRRMQLDGVDSDPGRAMGRCNEGVSHAREAISIERQRGQLASLIRSG